MTTERDFKGIWIPVEVLEKGLPFIADWTLTTYKINLLAEKPLQGDK
jgi:hypothetical protein